MLRNRPLSGYRFEASVYDAGDKLGCLKQTWSSRSSVATGRRVQGISNRSSCDAMNVAAHIIKDNVAMYRRQPRY